MPSGSFCGNSLVEKDEECDVGAGSTDKCCNEQCKLKPGALCRSVVFVCTVIGSHFFQTVTTFVTVNFATCHVLFVCASSFCLCMSANITVASHTLHYDVCLVIDLHMVEQNGDL